LVIAQSVDSVCAVGGAQGVARSDGDRAAAANDYAACGLFRGGLVKHDWRLDERSVATAALEDINPYQCRRVQGA